MAFKYIANGFQTDVDELLKEFVRKESSEFQVFASIWKKRNFSFIYIGRETAKELAEFTNEIFSLSLDLLISESFWQEICSVFLLYALYRNQILNRPVRIRIEFAKLEIMKRLLDKAIVDKLYSLHYVLDFLFKNAFELVASRTLLGPSVQHFDKRKSEIEKKLQLLDFKCNLKELMENKVLEELSESFLKYEKLKKVPRSNDAKSRCKKLIGIMNKLAAEQVNINKIGFITPSANLSSVMRSMRTPNKIRCEYPFIDVDLNQISDADNIDANEYNFDESEILGTSKDGCNSGDKQRYKITKPRSKKRSRKTSKTRKYYEGSSTKDILNKIVIKVPNTNFLQLCDSEDELLID